MHAGISNADVRAALCPSPDLPPLRLPFTDTQSTAACGARTTGSHPVTAHRSTLSVPTITSFASPGTAPLPPSTSDVLRTARARSGTRTRYRSRSKSRSRSGSRPRPLNPGLLLASLPHTLQLPLPFLRHSPRDCTRRGVLPAARSRPKRICANRSVRLLWDRTHRAHRTRRIRFALASRVTDGHVVRSLAPLAVLFKPQALARSFSSDSIEDLESSRDETTTSEFQVKTPMPHIPAQHVPLPRYPPFSIPYAFERTCRSTRPPRSIHIPALHGATFAFALVQLPRRQTRKDHSRRPQPHRNQSATSARMLDLRAATERAIARTTTQVQVRLTTIAPAASVIHDDESTLPTPQVCLWQTRTLFFRALVHDPRMI